MKTLFYFLIIGCFFLSFCKNELKDKSNVIYRTKKTYIQVDSGSINLSRVEKFDEVGKPTETIDYSYNSTNNENQISAISKFDKSGKWIETINYSTQNGLIHSVRRVFYDSLNRVILLKAMSFESKESGLSLSYRSYNLKGLTDKDVEIENYPLDTTITNYEYDSNDRITRTRITRKFNDRHSFTIENVYVNDSLSMEYYSDKNGLNRYIRDSTIIMKDKKIEYTWYSPNGNYFMCTSYYQNKLVIKEISEDLEVYYTYDEQNNLKQKVMIMHNHGGMFDAPGPSEKHIYTYTYE